MKGVAKWQKDQASAFGSPLVLTNSSFKKLQEGVWYYSFYGQDDTVLGKIKRNDTKLSLSGSGTHNVNDLDQGLGYLCTGGGCDPIWVYKSMRVTPKFKGLLFGGDDKEMVRVYKDLLRAKEAVERMLNE